LADPRSIFFFPFIPPYQFSVIYRKVCQFALNKKALIHLGTRADCARGATQISLTSGIKEKTR
jgi:hypothetical protein